MMSLLSGGSVKSALEAFTLSYKNFKMLLRFVRDCLERGQVHPFLQLQNGHQALILSLLSIT